MKLALFVLALAFAISETATAQRKITGRILDAESQAPVKDATVKVSGASIETTSNALGFFELTITPARHKELVISHPGFLPSSVPIPEVDRFKLQLQRAYHLLMTLDLNGFPRQVEPPYQPVNFPIGLKPEAETQAEFIGGMSRFYTYAGNALAVGSARIPPNYSCDVSFTIDENGKATAITISDSTQFSPRDIKRIFTSMPAWMSAKKGEVKIKQHFVLPVVKPGVPLTAEGHKELTEYLVKEIKFPEEARKLEVSGIVCVSFQLDPIGMPVNLRIVADIGGNCGAEVQRAVSGLTPDLTAGLMMQNEFTTFLLPVKFASKGRLTSDAIQPKGKEAVLEEIVVTPPGTLAVQNVFGYEVEKLSSNNSDFIPYTDLVRAVENSNLVRRLALDNRQLNSFPPDIMKLPGLDILSLENNKIQTLPNQIDRLTKLRELRLARNEISHLPPSFIGLKKLEVLGLPYNQFKTIPPEIFLLENLKVLDLRNNQLTYLPTEIVNMKDLEVLLLQNNKIEGLPSELFTLKKLTHVFVGGNPIDSAAMNALRKSVKKASVILYDAPLSPYFVFLNTLNAIARVRGEAYKVSLVHQFLVKLDASLGLKLKIVHDRGKSVTLTDINGKKLQLNEKNFELSDIEELCLFLKPAIDAKLRATPLKYDYVEYISDFLLASIDDRSMLVSGRFLQDNAHKWDIGIRFDKNTKGNFLIKHAFTYSLAHSWDVREGDHITAVQGIPAPLLGVGALYKLTKIGADSSISLTINRGGDVMKKTISIGRVPDHSHRHVPKPDSVAILSNGTLYYKVNTIMSGAGKRLRQFVVRNGPFTNLIIDLQNCTSGAFDGAVDLAGQFAFAGATVTNMEAINNGITERRARFSNSYDPLQFKNLLVLVGEQTASFGELVATSLKENSNAILIGSKTCGCGEWMQNVSIASDQYYIYMKMAELYTPGWKQISAGGIEPEIPVVGWTNLVQFAIDKLNGK